MAATEIESFLTPETCERAYRIARQCQEKRDYERASYGLRAARDRNPKLLKTLEAMAEATDKAEENQRGRTRRGMSTTHADKAKATEVSLCREAYKAVDSNNQPVMGHFQFIYYGAACVAGLVTGPYG
jgi:hypothetical protein